MFEKLGKAWRALERQVPIEPEPTFSEAGLILGAGAILAPADSNDGGRFIRLDGAEPRLLVLLSAAYGRPIGPEVTAHIQRASRHWSEGDAAMASMHLALATLGRLPRPRDAARRLFLADKLLEAGAEPETILRALDLDPDEVLTRAYNPDQPRVPAGSGTESGQWTSESGSGGGTTDGTPVGGGRGDASLQGGSRTGGQPAAPSAQDAATDALFESASPAKLQAARQAAEQLLAELRGAAKAATPIPPEAWLALMSVVRAASGPAVFFGVLFTPTNATVDVEEEIPGHPGYFYEHLPGEVGWHVLYVNAKGAGVEIPVGPDKLYRDAHGQPIARLLPNYSLALNPKPAPVQPTKNAPPEVCPKPTPDKFGQGPDTRSKLYENQMKPLLNPEAPTPPNFARRLPNLNRFTGVVDFDDCWLLNGTMFEYKGPAYAALISLSARLKVKFRFEKDWLEQSLAQVQAAASSNRPVIWVFAEREAAEYAFALFNQMDQGREKITVAVFPYLGE